MMRIRRTSVVTTIAVAGWLVAGAVAWACVPGGEAGTLSVSPPQARAGEQIKISGTAGGKSPVSVHLASGKLLAQVPVAPDEHGEGYQFTATVTVPSDTPLGNTSLVASQDNLRWAAPLVVVGQPTAVVAGGTGSSEAGSTSGSASTSMIAVSVAALLALAVLATVVVRRRRVSSPIEETPSEELVGSR
jgi:hypothetical protein